MGVGEPRVAHVGDEAHAGAARERRADQVRGGWRRGRQHAVDRALADHPQADADGVGHPRDFGIGQQKPAAGEARAQRQARGVALGAGEARGRRLAGRAAVGGAVHRRTGRNRRDELGIPRGEARVVGRQDVHLYPEIGEMAAELEHALHSAAPCGREVEADDQEAQRSAFHQSQSAAPVPAVPPRATMPSSRCS